MSTTSSTNQPSSASLFSCWSFESDSSDDEFENVITDSRNAQMARAFVEIHPGVYATHDYVREKANGSKTPASEEAFQRAYAIAQREMAANSSATKPAAAPFSKKATAQTAQATPIAIKKK